MCERALTERSHRTAAPRGAALSGVVLEGRTRSGERAAAAARHERDASSASAGAHGSDALDGRTRASAGRGREQHSVGLQEAADGEAAAERASTASVAADRAAPHAVGAPASADNAASGDGGAQGAAYAGAAPHGSIFARLAGWRAAGAGAGAISAAAATADAPSAAGAASRAESVAAAVSGAERAAGAGNGAISVAAAPAHAPSTAPGGAPSASSAAAMTVSDAEIAGLLAGMRLGPSDEKVTYAEVCRYGGGGAAEVAMAAKLDLLSDLDRETLWANLAEGWRDFLVPWPPGANRDMGALARLDPLYGGWPTLEEQGFRLLRHNIALALASERAFEANATRRRTRRGGQGRTRVQRPGGGSWLPQIYLGLADRNPAVPLPPGAPYVGRVPVVYRARALSRS